MPSITHSTSTIFHGEIFFIPIILRHNLPNSTYRSNNLTFISKQVCIGAPAGMTPCIDRLLHRYGRLVATFTMINNIALIPIHCENEQQRKMYGLWNVFGYCLYFGSRNKQIFSLLCISTNIMFHLLGRVELAPCLLYLSFDFDFQSELA